MENIKYNFETSSNQFNYVQALFYWISLFTSYQPLFKLAQIFQGEKERKKNGNNRKITDYTYIKWMATYLSEILFQEIKRSGSKFYVMISEKAMCVIQMKYSSKFASSISSTQMKVERSTDIWFINIIGLYCRLLSHTKQSLLKR